MDWRRLLHSLWFRLAWRTAVVLAVLFALGAAFLNVRVSQVVGRLVEATLSLQSAQLLPYVIDEADRDSASIPAFIQDTYSSSAETLIYALADARGRILWASSDMARALLTRRPLPPLRASQTFFRLTSGTNRPVTYSLMAQQVPDGGGSVLIVGRGIPNSEAHVFALRRIAADNIEWLLAASVVAALLAALWALWGSVAPLRALGHQAAAIGPGAPGLRLEQANMPQEVRRAVAAIDQAFQRLAAAYENYRNFSGTVAHELRGPLTMLSLQLEELKDNPAAAGLLQDVDRMKRLVEQLLAMVRADSIPLVGHERVDLAELARDVVATMAPGAIAAGVRLGLSAPHQPVWIMGDRLSLWLAVRNLIENAITHTEKDTEVDVAVSFSCALTVRDHGPGIPLEDRPRIFDRFWRRADAPAGGSGLGLAIVSEVAIQHGGSVVVDDAAGGGALFTLQFPPPPAP